MEEEQLRGASSSSSSSWKKFDASANLERGERRGMEGGKFRTRADAKPRGGDNFSFLIVLLFLNGILPPPRKKRIQTEKKPEGLLQLWLNGIRGARCTCYLLT